MKLTYDNKADAAYIYLEYPIKNGEVKKTVQLNDSVYIDLDNKQKILGVEILNASKSLKKEILAESKQIA